VRSASLLQPPGLLVIVKAPARAIGDQHERQLGAVRESVHVVAGRDGGVEEIVGRSQSCQLPWPTYVAITAPGPMSSAWFTRPFRLRMMWSFDATCHWLS
jgi:hypothetical protein